jgi:surface antigen
VAATFAAAVAITLAPASATAATAAVDLGSCLSAGQFLYQGQYLAAPGYQLIMQGDGNLVAYQSSGQPLWASQTNGHPGAYAALQSSDGNLVVYSPAGNALWSASVPASPGDRLCMQGDGNVVVYSAGSAALWATMTNITAGRGQTLSSNLFPGGQCTWEAEVQFSLWTGTYINTLGINGTNGNALYWAYNAAHRGWNVGSTPRIGSIAVFPPGPDGAGSDGHVAWVTDYYPSQDAIRVTEMNFNGQGTVDSRFIKPVSSLVQYIYANP